MRKPRYIISTHNKRKIVDTLILVHLIKKEMKSMTTNSNDNTKDLLKKNELLIQAFDIYHKTVEKGNGSNRISTTDFDIRYNPNDSFLLKTLLARCSEDHINNFAFILYRLMQMTNVETYRQKKYYKTTTLH